MEHSATLTEITAALAAFNATVTNPSKTKVARVKHRDGGQHSYPYEDLAAILGHIRPELAAAGLFITQEILSAHGGMGVQTTCFHSSGEWFRWEPLYLPVPHDADPKDIGGVISYARRYSLNAALGLAADEDEEALAAAAAAAPPAGGSARTATERQLAKIHAIAKEAGLTETDLRYHAQSFGKEYVKDLSTKDASALIDKLGSLPVPESPEGSPQASPDDDGPIPGRGAR